MPASPDSDSASSEDSSAVPPLHDSDRTSLDESDREARREAASTDPASKFGPVREGREGDGMRFPEEIDMRPKDKSHSNPEGADATPGSEEHPISPPEFPDKGSRGGSHKKSNPAPDELS